MIVVEIKLVNHILIGSSLNVVDNLIVRTVFDGNSVLLGGVLHGGVHDDVVAAVVDENAVGLGSDNVHIIHNRIK